MEIELERMKVVVYPDGRLDTDNAAKFLGLSPKTLAIMRSTGTGPKFIKRGRVFILGGFARMDSPGCVAPPKRVSLIDGTLQMARLFSIKVGGATLAKALGGRKAGGGWMAHCPAHDDREPSLTIRDADNGKVLVRCHAGCEQAKVIATLRSRGLWCENRHRRRRFTHPVPRAAANDRPDRDEAKRTKAALAIWQATTPTDGTSVETYLRSRGLQVSPPSVLRFHAGLKHPSGSVWPAMVAIVTRGVNGAPIAIHRTFLARNGSGKAPVDAHDVIVLADGDEPGEAAAQVCAWRWKRQGRRVRIARPPQGMDFNDLLMDRIEESGL
jgi:putative DNA primase/helicase